MTAYVVFQFNVVNVDKLSAYVGPALASVAQYGGRMICTGELSTLHLSTEFKQGTMLEFPDRASAQSWYDSPEYQKLIDLRTQAINGSVILIG